MRPIIWIFFSHWALCRSISVDLMIQVHWRSSLWLILKNKEKSGYLPQILVHRMWCLKERQMQSSSNCHHGAMNTETSRDHERATNLNVSFVPRRTLQRIVGRPRRWWASKRWHPEKPTNRLSLLDMLEL